MGRFRSRPLRSERVCRAFHLLCLDASPHVGAIPGVTKRVASTKVHVRPDIYMIDTPGIFLPEISDPEVGMKLALCGCMCLEGVIHRWRAQDVTDS